MQTEGDYAEFSSFQLVIILLGMFALGIAVGYVVFHS